MRLVMMMRMLGRFALGQDADMRRLNAGAINPFHFERGVQVK